MPDAPEHPEPHEHIWEAILTWTGRYRCRTCGGLGYRGLVSPLHAGDQLGPAMSRDPKPAEIIPYRCKAKGCRRAAVVKNPRQLCAEHRRKP